MDKIEIGIIVKPQGIKGEVKIKPMTDDVNRFTKLKSVIIDDNNVKVLSSRVAGGEVFLLLYGVADRNGAELLRGKSIYLMKEDIVLPTGSNLIVDIIGCSVVSCSGKKYGVVTEVLQHGAADVFVLDTDIMFPHLKKVIKNIDIENKTITVFEDKFDEVAVYED